MINLTKFARLKKINGWPRSFTISKPNLLERSAVRMMFTDVILTMLENKGVKVTGKIKLESLRYSLYKDYPKTVLNETSYEVKESNPKLKLLIKKISRQILRDEANVSNSELVQLISKAANLLTTLNEARSEIVLGNTNLKFVSCETSVRQRFYEMLDFYNSLAKDTVFGEVITEAFEDLVECRSGHEEIITRFLDQKIVTRWAGRLTLNNFNLTEHVARVSYLVDTLILTTKCDIKNKLHFEMLRYALYHDYPEAVFNDVNSPVKKLYPELDNLYRQLEKEVMLPLNLKYTKQIKMVCKFADVLDCYYESQSEKLAGNQDPEYTKVTTAISNSLDEQNLKYTANTLNDEAIYKCAKDMVVDVYTDIFQMN